MKKPSGNKTVQGKQKKSKTGEGEDEHNEEHDVTNPFLEKNRKGDDEDQDDEGPQSDDGIEVKGRTRKSTKKPATKGKNQSGEKKKKKHSDKKKKKNDGGDESNSSETEDDVATARMELDRAMARAQEAETAANPTFEIAASQHSELEARSELFNVTTGWGRHPYMFTAGFGHPARSVCLATAGKQCGSPGLS